MNKNNISNVYFDEEELNEEDYIFLDKHSREYRILRRVFMQMFLIRLVPVLFLLLAILALVYMIINNIQSTEFSMPLLIVDLLIIAFDLFFLKKGVTELISAGVLLSLVIKLKGAYVKIPTLEEESEIDDRKPLEGAKYKVEIRNAALIGNPEIALIEDADVPYVDYYRDKRENILIIFFKDLNDAKAARNILRYSDYNCSYAEEIMPESSAEATV